MLSQLPASLREHAAAAQAKFPKAAASGEKLASAIEGNRLEPMAKSATDQMLAADGEQGAQMAQRLEQAMAKLFGQCCNGNGQGDELDQYLKLSLGGSGRKSFSQMKQCRKFGNGQFPAMGMGRGQGQGSGYSMNSSNQVPVLGNEQFSPNGPKQSAKMAGPSGPSNGLANGAQRPTLLDQPDVMKGLNPVDRQSDATQSEGTIDQYRALVDEYFKNITHQ